MNIGCITLNAPTGVGYEMRWIMNNLPEEWNVNYISVSDTRFSAPSDWYKEDNFIQPFRFISSLSAIIWAKRNNIDCIICKQEQFNDNLLRIFNFLGIRTIVSIDLEDFDYFDNKWDFADFFVCPTQHSFDYLDLKEVHNKKLIPMGLDTKYFKMVERKSKSPSLFIHTAGHGGVGFRKSTPETIVSFHLASLINKNIKLTVLSQIGINEYPPLVRKIVSKNGKINFIHTRSPDNRDSYSESYMLYEYGDVAIQPSKWEGMGASVYEAATMGLPVLTTDFPPMNEYIQLDRGFLIKPYKFSHSGTLNKEYKKAHISITDLSLEILRISQTEFSLRDKSIKAREFMLKYDWENVGTVWRDLIISRTLNELKPRTFLDYIIISIILMDEVLFKNSFRSFKRLLRPIKKMFTNVN